MNFELLETQNLILRKLTPETYDFIFQHYNDDELKAFLGISATEALDKETTKLKNGLRSRSCCGRFAASPTIS